MPRSVQIRRYGQRSKIAYAALMLGSPDFGHHDDQESGCASF
jgi:hypothetical protein